MCKYQLCVTIVHTCNLTLLEMKDQIVHGISNFLVDDVIYFRMMSERLNSQCSMNIPSVRTK